MRVIHSTILKFDKMHRYGVPVLVAVNKFDSDTPAELEAVRKASLAAGHAHTLFKKISSLI